MRIIHCIRLMQLLNPSMRQSKAKKILEHTVKTYDKIAEEFDATRAESIKEFELFTSYVKPGARIADIGCGNGRLVRFLQNVSAKWPSPKYDYTGLDNSAALLALAKKRYPDETFNHGDLLKLPLEDGTTDTIFCIRAFHHLPSPAARLESLKEMRRILKNNGTLIITVWNLWQKKYLQYVLRGFLRFIYSLGGFAPNDTFIPWGKKAKRYYHAFTPMELNKIVSAAGFEIEELFFIRDGKRVPFGQSHDIVIIAKKITTEDAN
jgi:ubiquinone/menaquinone biosynthesis C-methylase UbiE